MASILTPTFSSFLIEDIQKHFTEESNTYVTIGRAIGTGLNASNVEPINWSINEKNRFYRNMVTAKKINAADIQPVIPRIDWKISTIYDTYEDHINIYSYEKLTSLGTANANSNTTLVGTVSINGSNAVTGSGTTFSTFIFPGDQISVNGSTKTVVSVPTNLLLFVDSNFANTNASQTITLVKNNKTVIANSISFIGTVETGNVVIIGEESREVTSIRSNKVITLNSSINASFSNTVISKRDNTYPATANTFYVRNSRDQIFKCLFNNSGTTSTIEPTISIDGQLPENPFILTADGYKWKYMYTIPAGLKQKFFTSKWMPVSNDAAVVDAATTGRIDLIRILWGGSGYIGGANSNSASIIEVTNSDGQGANIVASVLRGVITSINILGGGNNYTTGVISFNNSAQQLGATILGGTVNACTTTILANTSNTSYQSFLGNVFVNDIVTMNSESRNVVSVVSATQLTVNTPFTYMANTQVMSIERSNAIFDITFSPNGGHGSNPEEELGAHSLMISMEFDDTENETLPMSDQFNTFNFNQVGIVVDPLVGNGAFTANQTNYRVSTRLEVSDPGLTEFLNDETVYVGTSLSEATAIANVAHWDSGENYLYINNISGTLEGKQIIKGATTGATVPILSIANSEIKLYSGDLIFMENRSNINRNINQIDQVKIVLSF